jgi:type I restriction enzyme S subunit
LTSTDKSHYEKVPFDIPKDWTWVTLGDICELSTGPFGTMLHKSDYVKNGVPLVNPQNITNNGIIASKFVSSDTADRLNTYLLQENDVIIGRRGEMGRCAVVSSRQDGWLCGTGCFIIKSSSVFSGKFLAMIIGSEYSHAYLERNSIGATMNNLNHGILKLLLLPLPPISEQCRIVEAIESAFVVIDEIERNKSGLQAAVAAAKLKIISLAVRGKLVPQDPNDEPASVLLERIRTEREKLVKAGKIKRVKSESVIIRGDDNSYYADLPTSWEVCRIGSICEIARGGSPRPIKEFLTTANDGVNWIKIGDTEKNGKYINATAEKIKPSGISRSRMVHKGDFLLTNSMSFGRPYILNVDGCIHDGWLVISEYERVLDIDYFYHLLSSTTIYEQFNNVAGGSVVKNLNCDKVAEAIIAIPPLAEQRRIVTAIETAFAQLDSISAELA